MDARRCVPRCVLSLLIVEEMCLLQAFNLLYSIGVYSSAQIAAAALPLPLTKAQEARQTRVGADNRRRSR